MGLRQWVKDWVRLVDPIKKLPESDRAELEKKKRDAKAVLRITASEALKVLIESWKHDYDEVRSDWDSIQSRSSQLLLAVGLITGLAGVAAPFLSRALRIPVAIVVVAILVAVGLGVVACFTAIQVIRVQGVGFWTTTDLKPTKGWRSEQYQAEYAYQLFRASRENWLRLSVLVDRLRLAQLSALASLALLVALIILNLIVSSTAAPVAVPPTKVILVSPNPIQ
jgi:hypothetical protein